MMDKSLFLSNCYINHIIRHSDYVSGAPLGFQNPCFGYVLEGKTKFVASDRTLVLSKGDLVFIPKGQIYTSYWEAAPRVSLYSLNFEFISLAETRNLFEFGKVYAPELAPLFDSLHKNAKCTDVKTNFAALRDFYSVLDYACRHMKRAEYPKDSEVKRAVDYIESNFMEDIRVEELAKMCCMSQSKFYALFKKTMGYTPTDYKNLMKIRRVEQLLSYSEMTIEEICENSGFSSPSFLRRIYRKFTGNTPGTFAERMKKRQIDV